MLASVEGSVCRMVEGAYGFRCSPGPPPPCSAVQSSACLAVGVISWCRNRRWTRIPSDGLLVDLRLLVSTVRSSACDCGCRIRSLRFPLNVHVGRIEANVVCLQIVGYGTWKVSCGRLNHWLVVTCGSSSLFVRQVDAWSYVDRTRAFDVSMGGRLTVF